MLRKLPADWVVFPLHGTDGDCCTCGNRRCRSPGKHPFTGIKDFLNTALPRDEAYKKWPDHSHNWGVIPGKSGFVVFDVDVRNGKQGQESFAKLQHDYGKAPETRVIETWSGGFHVLFQRPDVPNTPNTNGTVAPGIDIRGDNGYIVAVGSTVFGKPYSVFKDTEIARMPDSWLPLVLPKSIQKKAEQTRSKNTYLLPNKESYQSQSEADFALAGIMKTAGQSFDQFCAEIGKFRGNDAKSKNQKYLTSTWNNALAVDQDDGEIDLIGFVSVPAGQYAWLCKEWTTINPFGRKTLRFDGSIIGGEYDEMTLPLYIHIPAKGATRASKLSKIWSIVGDGQPKFKADHIINRPYLVRVSESNNGSLVEMIVSPNPQWSASLKANDSAISSNPRPVPVKHIEGYRNLSLKEVANG